MAYNPRHFVFFKEACGSIAIMIVLIVTQSAIKKYEGKFEQESRYI